MGESRARQRQRESQQLARRRATQAANARATQRAQAEAAARREYKQSQHRHQTAYAVWTIAAVMAIAHFLEHSSTIRLMSLRTEDLVIGWPMAAFLAIVGGIVYGI